MIRTPAGRYRHPIRLDKPRPEDAGAPMSPNAVFAAIEPASAGANDEDHITHIVKLAYHPHITLNTRITTAEGRHLFVKGMQDIELRHIELWLLCEEVLTP